MIRSLGAKSMVALSVAMVAGAAGCRRMGAGDDAGQIGAAIGEVMSSFDESTQGTATASNALPPPFLRTPDALKGPAWRRALDALAPSAYAATCGEAGFSACAGGMRTRTFDDCSLGLATLAGSVNLTFNRPDLCVVATDGDSVTRNANFTLTGLYGGTLTVSAPGGGQTLTKTATGWTYSVGGMERVLKGPGGRTLFDVATTTTTPIAISGTSRADFKIVSGALVVEHKLAKYSVTLVPDNLAWSSSCTCAVSGSLTGTVSGGKHDGRSASVTLTGCGEADVTIDGETESITLDRCTAI